MFEGKSTVLQVVYGFSLDHVIMKNGFYDTLKILQHKLHDVVFFSRELDVSEKGLSLHGGFHERFQIFRRFEKCLYNDRTDERFGSFLDRITPDVVHFHSFESFSLSMFDECKKRNISVFLSVHEGENPHLYEKYQKLGVPDSILYKNNTTSVEEYAENLKIFYNEYSQQRDRVLETPICSGLKKYKVSIVMPTYNGEEFLESVLGMIKDQKTDFLFELIIVDSGSTDRTVEIIKDGKVPNCSFYAIKKGAFNHGLTRNFGVSKSCGEIVVLLTQDAVPVDENWLTNIVSSYKDNNIVAGYVRQIPRDNCNLIIGRRAEAGFTGSGKSYLTDVCDFETYDSLSPFEKYKLTNFDDVCSSFRRSFWEKNPYKKTNFAEDLMFGIDIVLSGGRIFYAAETAVIHSHDYSFFDAYKRFYISFLVLLEFYDLANVRGVSGLFKLVGYSIKSDVKFIRACRVSLWDKMYHFYFLFFFNILTGLAQFMAYRDFQKGKIKTSFIN